MSTLTSEINDIGTNFNQTLVLTLVYIINNVFTNNSVSSITIGQYALNHETEYQHYDIITEVLIQASNYLGQKTNGTKIKFVIEGKNNYSDAKIDDVFAGLTEEEIFFSTYGIREKAIWFIDSMDAYDHLEMDLVNTRNHYRRNGYFCIVYTGHGKVEERLLIIKEIFRRLFVLYVININVLLVHNNKVYMYTYFPYNKKTCAASRPSHYHTFSTKLVVEGPYYKLDKKLFPNKVANCYGCEVIVATWPNPPYIFIDQPKEKGGKLRLRGIEGNILQLLADKMNFTIKYEKTTRGVIYENGSSTGALQMVHDAKANITIGVFMYNKKRSDYLLATVSYLSTRVVIVIPKGHRMSPFQRLTKPFKYIIWSCFSTTVLCAILIIFSLKCLRRNNVIDFVFGAKNWMPFTNLWNSLYGGSIGIGIPRRNFARYLLAVWLMYTMVLRNAYIAELFQILQDGRSKTNIETIVEAVNKNYTFYVSTAVGEVLKSYVGTARTEDIDIYCDRDVLFKRVNLDASRIVLVVFAPTVSYYNRRQNDTNQRVYTLGQNLLTIPFTMYMRHHSYFKHYMNEMLMSIMSAGLISKEVSFYMDKNLDSVKVEQRPIALTFWLLFGLFSVYLVLLLGCVLIFLLEMWSRRSPLTRCVLDFFNC